MWYCEATGSSLWKKPGCSWYILNQRSSLAHSSGQPLNPSKFILCTVLYCIARWYTVNPNLPFYYWTGAKGRYQDFALPSFNDPTGPGIGKRLDRIKLSRRGDPGVFVAYQASLPQRRQITARANFHKTPVALPPSQVLLQWIQPENLQTSSQQ